MIDMNDMNKRLKEIEREIEDYQTECKHKNQIIKTVKIGDTRWVCDKCQKALSWPTPKELNMKQQVYKS